MEIRLVLTAFIVLSFRLIHGEPTNQEGHSKVQDNLRDLFDSINNNNARKTKDVRNILGREAAREQQVFDTVKEDLRLTRQRNAHKQKDIEHKMALKREAPKTPKGPEPPDASYDRVAHILVDTRSLHTGLQRGEESLVIKNAQPLVKQMMRIPGISNGIEMKCRADAANHHAIKREVDSMEEEDYDYSDLSTTKEPVYLDPEHRKQYLVACNDSLAFYNSQKTHAESIKQKYFMQLTKKTGIELKALYDLIFRVEDVAVVEQNFITDHIKMDESNFTGWTPPLEKLQIVKLLHTWRELIRCIDMEKGENPPEAILDIRREAFQAFDEIAPWVEAGEKLMHGLPQVEKKEEKKKKEEVETDTETLESILRTTSTVRKTTTTTMTTITTTQKGSENS